MPAPVLALEDVENEGVDELVARGAAYARGYLDIKNRETTMLRNIAVVLIAIRAQCTDTQGRVDWRGQSHEYRALAKDVYAQANVPPDSLSYMQSNVRYHVGNILRDVLTPAELAAYELRPDSPAEANAKASRAQRALALAAATTVPSVATSAQPAAKASKKTVTAQDEADGAPDQQPDTSGRAVATTLRLTQGAHGVISQISADVISSMTDGQRARMDEQLAEMQTAISALRRKIRRASAG
ncbi:hypothetical protein [Streptomyces sp. NPDC048603]|uniref:hypothetical protein n=1 Tax=Streptomyces sp. NPDC048603 TaxID=3365577 RepID=UPI00371594E0